MNIEDQTYEIIKKRLLLGEFEDRFHSESELANELNISRTPVRAALKQLEYEGLITYYRNKGIKVRRASINETVENQEVIFIFIAEVLKRYESGYIELDFKQLQKKIQEARKLRKTSNIYEYSQLVFSIYELLISSLKNEVINLVVHRAGTRVMTSTIYKRVEEYRNTLEKKKTTTISQLHDIVNTLEKQDYELAHKLFKTFKTYSMYQIAHTGTAL